MRNPKQQRRYAPRALAESIDRLTRPFLTKRGFAQGAVVRDWSAIVGAQIAGGTMPERIVYPDRGRINGTLHLRVGNGALATQLQHLEPILIERVNGYFGYPAVGRISYIQRPLPPMPKLPTSPIRPLDAREEDRLRQTLDRITDPDLHKSLAELGRAVLGRNRIPQGGG